MTKPIPRKLRARARGKRKSVDAGGSRSADAKRPGGKLGLILERIETKKGATVDELAEMTGWQKHSVRGALSRLRARGFVTRLGIGAGRKAYQLDRVER